VYKIVILIEPAEGHFNPFVPIITKFVEQGYQVVCMTGSNFKERVEKTGATFHNIPSNWDPEDKDIFDIFPELKKRRGLSQIKYYLKHILFEQVPDVLNALKEILENFEADVVICDSFMIAGGWMTELGGKEENDMFHARGYGGQYIMIIEDLNMVIVVTASD
jgi:UDP:flavonoid glycosyltransferase YjiC (YdhE family)